jgi:hypothetical protein
MLRSSTNIRQSCRDARFGAKSPPNALQLSCGVAARRNDVVVVAIPPAKDINDLGTPQLQLLVRCAASIPKCGTRSVALAQRKAVVLPSEREGVRAAGWLSENIDALQPRDASGSGGTNSQEAEA